VDAVPTPAPPVELPRDPNEEIPLSEASRLSGYSVDTLRRWIREKELPARKGAKEWRVRRADLAAAIGASSGPASVVDIREDVRKIRAGGRGRP
jgi:excisionase family DNA binding protein